MTYHLMMIDFSTGNEREWNNTYKHIDCQYATEDSATLEAQRVDFGC
jgi:hypothetical protein